MSNHSSERRVVLRTLALLALSLSGCQQKKEAAAPNPAPEAAAPPTPAPSGGTGASPQPGGTPQGGTDKDPPAPSGKLSKAQVQYQEQPKADQKCSTCMHFIPESNTCKLVEGQISPNGWCTLWAKKA